MVLKVKPSSATGPVLLLQLFFVVVRREVQKSTRHTQTFSLVGFTTIEILDEFRMDES
jgi:hypothetical protein